MIQYLRKPAGIQRMNYQDEENYFDCFVSDIRYKRFSPKIGIWTSNEFGDNLETKSAN